MNRAALLGLLMTICSVAFAQTFTRDELRQCAFIDPPVIADGSTADAAVVQRLDAAVRSYVAAMQESLACLDRLLDRPLEQNERLALEAAYNNGVDQMTFVAGEHNRQVQNFRRTQRLPDPPWD